MHVIKPPPKPLDTSEGWQAIDHIDSLLEEEDIPTAVETGGATLEDSTGIVIIGGGEGMEGAGVVGDDGRYLSELTNQLRNLQLSLEDGSLWV